MTGMKEGAGEDPFAEMSAETDDSDLEQTETEPEHAPEEDSVTNESGTERSSPSQEFRIPYKFRRDGVQDGRDRVPLFIMDQTKQAEREALRDLEERFGGNVSLTDLREAVVRAGLDDLDSVADTLEEWGYGMTFDT